MALDVGWSFLGTDGAFGSTRSRAGHTDVLLTAVRLPRHACSAERRKQLHKECAVAESGGQIQGRQGKVVMAP